MARSTVSLNEALQALRNEASRSSEKVGSVAVNSHADSLSQLLRKTAQMLRDNDSRDVTYDDLYRVKEAFYARR